MINLQLKPVERTLSLFKEIEITDINEEVNLTIL